jgi:PAS domain S-box-containing protein
VVKSDQINNKNDEEYHQYSEMVSTIFELSPDAISLTKVSDGEIIDCNLEYLNQIGYSREEVIGHTSLELELFNFDERQVFVNEIRKKQAISDYEIKVKRKDNVFINILYSARFITVNGIQTILCIGKDITERKKVEQQIRQNADLLDQLYDAVIRTDTNFKINYWNKAAEKLFGYSQDEALGINSTELLCPIYAPGERETKSEELKKKGILKTINKFKHKNGTDIIVEQNATQINDNSGVPIGYIVIYHDITVQKKAEEFNQKLLENEQQLTEELTTSNEELQSTTEELQVTNEELRQQEKNQLSIYNELQESHKRLNETLEELSKSETLLSSIMNLSSDVIYVKDRQSRWIFANPALERIVGKSSDDLLGKNDLEIYSDHEIGRTILENDNKIMDSGKEKILEEVVETQDGIRSFISVKTPRFNNEGRVIGIVGISHDITRRKKIEEALKKSESSLAEAQHIAHIGSWEWNIKTGDITWSNELYSLYKLDPNKFTPTMSSFAEYVHPDDEEYVNQILDQLLSKGKSHFDFRIVLDDGSIHVLNTIAEVAEFDKNGNPLIILGINQDITERKEIELKLNENMKKLAQSNKELEQFAYITSHDLREPLRMITSFLQLLERRYKDQLDQDANEFIGFAVNGAKRLDTMTKDLLQYSQITHKKGEIVPVNFEHVLEHTLTNLKVQIEENNAIITHDPLPTINGDEELKIQLFQNIIGNAIKYRSQKTPKIHISATKEKNQYLFNIKDNGIGISSKHLERIFTIFQRLHTQEEYEGTGIGLAIAQKIIHQQGGQIWVESELGKGTTFYFTIIIN